MCVFIDTISVHLRVYFRCLKPYTQTLNPAQPQPLAAPTFFTESARMEDRLEGLGLGGLGSRAWGGSGFRACGMQNLGAECRGLGFRVSGFGFGV